MTAADYQAQHGRGAPTAPAKATKPVKPMAASPAPPPSSPPRYHATMPQGDNAPQPGTYTARLTVMPPEVWAKVEALLLAEGFKPY